MIGLIQFYVIATWVGVVFLSMYGSYEIAAAKGREGEAWAALAFFLGPWAMITVALLPGRSSVPIRPHQTNPAIERFVHPEA
jgi:hypothetical protein